jgi:hypothetical protein
MTPGEGASAVVSYTDERGRRTSSVVRLPVGGVRVAYRVDVGQALGRVKAGQVLRDFECMREEEDEDGVRVTKWGAVVVEDNQPGDGGFRLVVLKDL